MVPAGSKWRMRHQAMAVRLVAPMTATGTNLTSSDVRSSAAMGGGADIAILGRHVRPDTKAA